MTKEISKPANPVPEGYHTVTPCLVVHGAQKLLDFLKAAFGAKETFCFRAADDRIAHAEILIGDSIIMLADATPESEASSTALYMYVEDVDAVYAHPLEAGGKSAGKPTNQFYGDRSARIIDPLGNRWGIATRIEDVPPEELERRAAAQGNP
jgi:PhnB protein